MPTVFIPTMLRDVTAGVDRVQVDGRTVAETIDVLEQKFPGVRERLCKGEQLTPGLQVSVDNVMSSRGLRTKVSPDSEVHFLPAIGGG